MVAPSKRSSSVKRVKRRTPGGRTTVLFRGEKAGRPSCGRCGTPVLWKASRKYGGVLCPPCLEELLRYVTRMESKAASPEVFSGAEFVRDLTVEKFLPEGWWAAVSSDRKSVV